MIKADQRDPESIWQELDEFVACYHPENRYERQFGKLLEVYLPIRQPSGNALLFEAYYRYEAVAASGRKVWRSFAPVALGALIVLELVQIPLAWSLAARLRHRQRERDERQHAQLDGVRAQPQDAERGYRGRL